MAAELEIHIFPGLQKQHKIWSGKAVKKKKIPLKRKEAITTNHTFRKKLDVAL
jgi:hypothetical protein